MFNCERTVGYPKCGIDMSCAHQVLPSKYIRYVRVHLHYGRLLLLLLLLIGIACELIEVYTIHRLVLALVPIVVATPAAATQMLSLSLDQCKIVQNHEAEVVVVLLLDESDVAVGENNEVFVDEVEGVGGVGLSVEGDHSDHEVGVVAAKEADHKVVVTADAHIEGLALD